MEVPTSQLKQDYPQIIDRLDTLYSIGLKHTFSDQELAEIDELRQRALLISTELAQRERYPTAQTA